jgi:hypothetical protein
MEEDHLKEQGVDERIIFKWMLENWDLVGGAIDRIDLAQDRDR